MMSAAIVGLAAATACAGDPPVEAPTTTTIAAAGAYPQHTAAIAADPQFELATHSQTHRAFRRDCWGLGVVPAGEKAAEVAAPIAGRVDRGHAPQRR